MPHGFRSRRPRSLLMGLNFCQIRVSFISKWPSKGESCRPRAHELEGRISVRTVGIATRVGTGWRPSVQKPIDRARNSSGSVDEGVPINELTPEKSKSNRITDERDHGQ